MTALLNCATVALTMTRVFLITCLLLLSATAHAETEQVKLRHVQRVIIDPGHGGDNTGCMGFHGVYEKFVTLPIALRIAEQLRMTTDAEVLLTREDDHFLGLRDRTRFANTEQADIFLSIHINASPHPSVQGVETYFLSTDSASTEIAALVDREQSTAEATSAVDLKVERKKDLDRILLDMQLGAAHALSETLAASIQRQMVRAVESQDRGVKQAPFAVLKESHCPAVVIECGFLTHAREGIRLLSDTYQKKLATGIVDGIIAYDSRIHRRTRSRD